MFDAEDFRYIKSLLRMQRNYEMSKTHMGSEHPDNAGSHLHDVPPKKPIVRKHGNKIMPTNLKTSDGGAPDKGEGEKADY